MSKCYVLEIAILYYRWDHFFRIESLYRNVEAFFMFGYKKDCLNLIS